MQIGLSLSLPGIATLNAGGWSPLALFQPGDVGRFGDPSDLSSVYQDVAGTTPVTADGQFVGLYRDKSSNANNLTQSQASSKPAWRTSGGLSWLEADGVDDYLSMTSAFLYAAGSGCVYAAIRAASQTDRRLVAEASSASTAPLYSLAQSASGAGAQLSTFIRNDANTEIMQSAARGLAFDGTDRVVGFEDTGSQIVYYVDGAETARVSYTRVGSLTANRFAIFALLRATAQSFMSARLYADVEIGRSLTAAERASLVTYLARKQGRSL